MEREEFGKIIMALKTYYSREKNLIPNEIAIELWYNQLKDIDYNVLMLALNKWVATSKWSPSVSDLRRCAMDIMDRQVDSDWSEAWERVLLAIKTIGMYRVDEAVDFIGENDDIAKTTIKRMGFKEICLSDNIVADRARFAQIYEQVAERNNRVGLLSVDMNKQISRMKEQYRLELADAKKALLMKKE